MPQPTNEQDAAPVKQESQLQKHVEHPDDAQKAAQDSRLREQAFDVTNGSNLDRAQEKRRRLEISL